jgi:hypothetical protein
MIDVSKLKTFSNYGRIIGKSRQWVYELAKESKIKVVEIDGVKFVQL